MTSRYRQQPGRTAALLVLVLTFCIAALFASGAFDSEADLSEGSTVILAPGESATPAEPEDKGNTALLGLVALLLLVGGVLLLQFALPSRRERRRLARRSATAPVGVRRPLPDVDPAPTLVLPPVSPCPVPAPTPPVAAPACRCGAAIDEPLVLVDPAGAQVPATTPTPAPLAAPPAVSEPVPRRVGARIGHRGSVRISPVAPVYTPR